MSHVFARNSDSVSNVSNENILAYLALTFSRLNSGNIACVKHFTQAVVYEGIRMEASHVFNCLPSTYGIFITEHHVSESMMH